MGIGISSTIAHSCTAISTQVHVQVTVDDDEVVVWDVLTHPGDGLVLSRCWMLRKKNAHVHEIIRHNRRKDTQDQHHTHNIEAYQFANPVHDGIDRHCHVDSHQWNERDKVKREYNTSTYEQNPEANSEQC